MASDAYYISPVAEAARMHSDAGSFVYNYVNNYQLGTMSRQDAERPSSVIPKWLGVFHNTDVYLLFGFPWLPKKLLPNYLQGNQSWTVLDRNMSEFFMESMRQFSKKKDPNHFLSSSWQNMDIRHWLYLDINVTSKMSKDYRWVQVGFWNDYLTSVANLWTTTISPTIGSLLWEKRVLQGLSATFIILSAIAAFLAATFAYMLWSRRNSSYRKYDQSKYDANSKPTSNGVYA